MRRDLARLAREEFDLLVIGGGVYGAAVAWDASLRGLKVALLEKDDFGGGTSWNSLKVVHGGLRYLSDGNLPRVRTMVRERRALLRIAPHLVRPLPFLLPTYGNGMRSRTALRLALLANEWIGFDRNRELPGSRALPGGRVARPQEFADRLPALGPAGQSSGAAVWFDAQIANTERLVISFLKSAALHGAALANYLSATRLLIRDHRVVGARGQDRLSGQELDVRARVTVNAAGPWVDAVLTSLRRAQQRPVFLPSLAVNVVTRQVIPGVAVGVPAQGGGERAGSSGRSHSTIFVVPWKSKSLIGTMHTSYRGNPDELRVPENLVRDLIGHVNQAFPQAALSTTDVCLIHRGLLPVASTRGSVDLIREGWLVDHRRADGVEGLLTVVGVKMTACRDLAEKTVDRAFALLGGSAPACRTASTPLVGAEVPLDDPATGADGESPDGTEDPESDMRRMYGRESDEVIACVPSGADADDPLRFLDAQAVYAARAEMAQHLSDVVLRRTDIGAAGPPSDALLRRLAMVLGAELGWDAARVQEEIGMTQQHYAGRTLVG